MLKPKELQNLPKGLTDIYLELSEFVLRDIARRIAKAAEITDTAEYQLYRARALGLSTKEITAEIARINGVAESEIEKIIREAAEKSDEFDRRMLSADGAAVTFSDNEELQALMSAEINNTRGQCKNYTGTLGFAEVNAAGNVVYSSMTDFLRKQMDMAHMKVASGVTDYNTAVRQACGALSDSGLRTVYYESGRSDRIEVAVRRALMTSVSQVTQRISEQNAEEFGADGWEITAHAGARPSHAVYQGKQFPNSKYELIVRPLIEDYNCRHSAFPIIMGVSQPAYTEEELANIELPPFTYEGRTYTAYQAQQQMRKMERAMRKQKDRCITADAAGDKDTFTAASIKLRRQKDYYEDFCRAAGTYTEYERTFVQGYDRHLAGKTGAVTRKQNAFKNAQVTLNQSLPLTNGGNGGIIPSSRFTPAANVEKAEEYAKNTLGIPNVSYKGVDVTTANEWNRGLYDTFNKFPELKSRFGFVGECHARNDALKPVAVQFYTDAIVNANPNVNIVQLQPYIDKRVKDFMKKASVSSKTMAQSYSPTTAEFLPFRGITVNSVHGKDSKLFAEKLKQGVDTKFHPQGCTTIRSVLDHEIGHQLDDLLGIGNLQDIQDLYTSRTLRELTDGLSEYAWNNKNKNKFSEMIAEGWAEYCNNPNPREIAKKIGETIEAEYKKQFGKP